MLEKYLKMIEKSRGRKDVIQDFLASDIGLSDFSFDVVGDKLKIEASSQDRFIMKIKEQEIKDFLAKEKLYMAYR